MIFLLKTQQNRLGLHIKGYDEKNHTVKFFRFNADCLTCDCLRSD
jgi:hypothetical protein